MTTRLALVVLFVASLVIVGGTGAEAVAPSATIDRSPVSIGARVLVSLHDWPDNAVVTISICGNGARRGSPDCNLTDSVGTNYSPLVKEHTTQFLVKTPPYPCPCVIRVSDTNQDNVALVPIELFDFPSQPTVGVDAVDPISVSLRVRHAGQGLFGTIKSWLGGPTTYDVTVEVRNLVGETLGGVELRGRAGRHISDQARLLHFPPIGSLAPSQAWNYTQRVKLSAPVLGSFHWTVNATGAGSAVTATATSHHTPWLFFILAVVLLGDLLWIAYRRVRKLLSRETTAQTRD